ncbi:phosphonate C-P lyase system protein PhnH [Roseovarius salinarum]|uniref:phosphonate C-P lyase system protein PhnH n=1 Tax=Roseovarius salinarum TaxID=1981892 RepID=UPI000C34B797|nr:phosphonate C-P lyase system protein PhnH [Roseovarius salinarum]
MHAQALEGGFTDAPTQAAQAFRAAMSAMARPGRIESADGVAPPAPVSPAAGALLLTLCDPETPLHLAGDHDTPEVRDWVTFHAGAPLVGAEAAQFALGTWAAVAPLDVYAIGTPEYPDRSATLIVEVAHLVAEGARLTGPGLCGAAELSLPETEAFRRNAALFPLGLDFFFTHGTRLAALPRTTRVEGT